MQSHIHVGLPLCLIVILTETLPHRAKQTHDGTSESISDRTETQTQILTCEMYPGGTWIGGIDPFGDIMGTSAGPEREEIYLFKQTAHAKVTSHLHSSI